MNFLPTLGDVSPFKTFPISVTDGLNKVHESFINEETYGVYSKDGEIIFLYRGSTLEVLYSASNDLVNSWTSHIDRPVTGRANMIITCLESLDCIGTGNIRHRSSRVVIGLDVPTDASLVPDQNYQDCVSLRTGMIIVFNYILGKVVRAIKFPHRVTSLCVISSASDETNQRFLVEDLLFFHGLIAVGTQEGHVYLLDLVLDQKSKYFISNESDPAEIRIVNREDLVSSANAMSSLRTSALRYREHLCFSLNQSSFSERRQAFVTIDSLSGKTVHFPETAVEVTWLSFIPQLGSILVGFNIGIWQIWPLGRLCERPEFSSVYSDDSQPIVRFMYLEPENDPRNYCYVWICSGDLKKTYDQFYQLRMFALVYEHKSEDDEYGMLYRGLKNCNQSFEFNLPAKENKTSLNSGSSFITCHPMGFGRHTSRIRNPDFSDPDMALGVFLWRTTSDSTSLFMGIFDLNMWYKAQMPSSFAATDDASTFEGHCSYFSVVSLDKLFRQGIQDGQKLLDLRIQGAISRYHTQTFDESHFFPSSLLFNVVFLLDQGTIHYLHEGLPRKIVSELKLFGVDKLVAPSDLYRLCTLNGLIQNPMAEAEIGQSAKTQVMRKELLTVILEHPWNAAFFKKCFLHWADGKYSSVGCTITFLLDWAWDKVVDIKQFVDRVTLPLFDYSGRDLDEKTTAMLHESRIRLRHLENLLAIPRYNNHSTYTESTTYLDLETKEKVVRLVAEYLDVIIWFLTVGLLPEVPDHHSTGETPFPATLLRDQYDDMRNSMRASLEKWAFSKDLKNVLIIDHLCAHLGEQLVMNFEREGGTGVYPPPTLHSLLSCFLIDPSFFSAAHDDNWVVHRIVQYLFLDLSHVLGYNQENDSRWSQLKEMLIKYPSAYAMPAKIIHVTHGFWLLDHGDLEGALQMLQTLMGAPGSMFDWEYRAILTSFMAQDAPHLALKYLQLSTPAFKDEEDFKLQLSILLACGEVLQAYQFQKVHSSTSVGRDLIRYFFEKADQLKKLKIVMSYALSPFEEEELFAFLSQSKKESYREILVTYHLERSKFVEARRIYDKIKCSLSKEARIHAIMKAYQNCLPLLMGENELVLSSNDDRLRIQSDSGSNFPVPFSVEVVEKNFNAHFHAGSIQEEMIRFKSDIAALQPLSQTPFRPRHSRRMPKDEHLPSLLLSSKYTEELSTPPNKRFCPNSTFDSNETIFVKVQRVLSHKTFSPFIGNLSTRIASVLSTPNIVRTPVSVRDRYRREIKPISKNSDFMSANTTTPTSILKRHLLPELSDTPVLPGEAFLSNQNDEEFLVSAPSLSASENVNKSLRFTFPSSPDIEMETSLDQQNDSVCLTEDGIPVTSDRTYLICVENKEAPVPKEHQSTISPIIVPFSDRHEILNAESSVELEKDLVEMECSSLEEDKRRHRGSNKDLFLSSGFDSDDSHPSFSGGLQECKTAVGTSCIFESTRVFADTSSNLIVPNVVKGVSNLKNIQTSNTSSTEVSSFIKNLAGKDAARDAKDEIESCYTADISCHIKSLHVPTTSAVDQVKSDLRFSDEDSSVTANEPLEILPMIQSETSSTSTEVSRLIKKLADKDAARDLKNKIESCCITIPYVPITSVVDQAKSNLHFSDEDSSVTVNEPLEIPLMIQSETSSTSTEISSFIKNLAKNDAAKDAKDKKESCYTPYVTTTSEASKSLVTNQVSGVNRVQIDLNISGDNVLVTENEPAKLILKPVLDPETNNSPIHFKELEFTSDLNSSSNSLNIAEEDNCAVLDNISEHVEHSLERDEAKFDVLTGHIYDVVSTPNIQDLDEQSTNTTVTKKSDEMVCGSHDNTLDPFETARVIFSDSSLRHLTTPVNKDIPITIASHISFADVATSPMFATDKLAFSKPSSIHSLTDKVVDVPTRFLPSEDTVICSQECSDAVETNDSPPPMRTETQENAEFCLRRSKRISVTPTRTLSEVTRAGTPRRRQTSLLVSTPSGLDVIEEGAELTSQDNSKSTLTKKQEGKNKRRSSIHGITSSTNTLETLIEVNEESSEGSNSSRMCLRSMSRCLTNVDSSRSTRASSEPPVHLTPTTRKRRSSIDSRELSLSPSGYIPLGRRRRDHIRASSSEPSFNFSITTRSCSKASLQASPSHVEQHSDVSKIQRRRTKSQTASSKKSTDATSVVKPEAGSDGGESSIKEPFTPLSFSPPRELGKGRCPRRKYVAVKPVLSRKIL